MKQLYLLRHAKSAWDEPGLPDRERGLNKRGRRAALAMGRALSGLLKPVALDVSPATRAQLTLAGVCRGWPELGGLAHRTCEELYTFDVADQLEWLARQDRDAQDVQESERECIFMLGHNPAFTDLVNVLAGQHVLDNLPTAGFASLELDIDRWRDLRQGCGTLVQTLFPRQLEYY